MREAKLQYVLKVYDIKKEEIMEINDWSRATYYRKMNGDSDWTIGEANNLIKLGAGVRDVIDIFF